MPPLRFHIICILLYCCIIGCGNEMRFTGHWRPSKATIWNSYHNDSTVIDLKTRQFYYDSSINDYTTKLLTPSRKDSFLRLLAESFLVLDSNGTFEMEDHAFFVLNVADTAWNYVRAGKWLFSDKDSVFRFSHPNGLTKCFKLLDFKKDQMTIGELFECQDGATMTEVKLHREGASANRAFAK